MDDSAACGARSRSARVVRTRQSREGYDLIRFAVTAAGEKADVDMSEIDVDLGCDDEHNELIGSTLQIVYDPATERVRSFAITDFGESNGTLSVLIRDGVVDPALLDHARVTGPNTRILDLDALRSLFEGFSGQGDTDE